MKKLFILKHQFRFSFAVIPLLLCAALAQSQILKRELMDGYLSPPAADELEQSQQLQTQTDIRPLPVGETTERNLKGGEPHYYRISLKKGQVGRLAVSAKGVDVKVIEAREDDQKVIGLADLSFGFGRETLTFVAEQDGVFLTLIYSTDPDSHGIYQLQSEVKTTATPADLERIQAEQLLSEALFSRNKGDAAGIGEAIVKLERALPLWERLGDQYWEAYTCHHLGRNYFDLGETQKALTYYNRALPLHKAAGDKDGEGTTLNNIGLIYSDSGERRKALAYNEQALPIFRAIGDTISEAFTLNNIGAIYDDLGEKQSALKNYQQALSLFKNADDKYGETLARNNIGKVYSDLGDKQNALTYLNQALKLARAANNKAGEAAILNNLNSVSGDLGEKSTHIDNLIKSLQLTRETGNRSYEATLLSNIGYAYADQSEWQKALDYFNQALPLLRAVNDKQREAETLNNEMVVWDHLDNHRMAIFYGKQAINKFQELRASVKGVELEMQKSFFRSVQAYYRTLFEILMKEGQVKQAIQVLNLRQDQQFFDFDREANVAAADVTRTLREQEVTARYETAIARIGQLSSQIENLRRQLGNRRLSEPETAQLQNLQAELKAATEAFSAVLGEAAKEFSRPPDDKDQVSEVREVADMQAALIKLGVATKQKPVTLYTLIGSDKLYILLITPDDQVKAFASPIQAEEFNNKIKRFYDLLKSPTDDPRPLGQELYEIIFKPLESELAKLGAQTLMWSLDGNLRYIPMAALWDGKRYLVERYQNVAFTRADSERMLRAASTQWAGTGFGSSQAQTVDVLGDGDKITFPPLPGVTKELQAIFRAGDKNGAVINGAVFSDRQFTKTNFYEAMQQHRPFVHISSHFSFRPGDDSRSFLLMGDGSALTLNEMKKQQHLFSGVELLTLSACNTAATQADANGKEIDGFAELAQRLGASAVMATLWSVADDSTSLLMSEFYRTLKTDRQTGKAAALRKAQLSLLHGAYKSGETPRWQRGPKAVTGNEKSSTPFPHDKQAPYAHPYFWSPFVLIGNWR